MAAIVSPNTVANGNLAAIDGILADQGTGTASGFHNSVAVTPPDWATRAGNGSATSFAGASWALNDYFQFTFSFTENFIGLNVSWDQTGSNSSPGKWKLYESATANGTYTAVGAQYTVRENIAAGTVIAWSPSTADASYTFSDVALALTTRYVRFVVDDGSATAAGGSGISQAGTTRMDNVTVTGLTPEPGTWACMAAGLGVLLFLHRRSRRQSAS